MKEWIGGFYRSPPRSGWISEIHFRSPPGCRRDVAGDILGQLNECFFTPQAQLLANVDNFLAFIGHFKRICSNFFRTFINSWWTTYHFRSSEFIFVPPQKKIPPIVYIGWDCPPPGMFRRGGNFRVVSVFTERSPKLIYLKTTWTPPPQNPHFTLKWT